MVQSVLRAYGIRRTQEALAYFLKTPRVTHKGTDTKEIIAVLKRYGLLVESGTNFSLARIVKHLSHNRLAIVCITEPHTNAGHYVVVDTISKTHVYIMDPYHRLGINEKISRKEFEKLWYDNVFTKTKRFAMIVGT